MIRGIVAIAASAVLLSASALPPTLHLTPREMAALAATNAKANAEVKREAKASTRINYLVEHIDSLKDSRRVVRLVVKDLGKRLPPGLASQKMETIVAEAEYRSVSQPNGLISDQRIADAWNAYIDEIGAPKDQHVSAALIYNLLDADYTTALGLWNSPIGRGLQTMPAIFAVASDGKLRHGATALEAARVLDDFAVMPGSVQTARNRVKMGILWSDWLAQMRKHPPRHVYYQVAAFAEQEHPSPVAMAVRRYVREHGAAQYKKLLEGLADRVFPAQSAG